MKIFYIIFLLIQFISPSTGDDNEIEATNYKCDMCNLIIKEAFLQQYLAREENFKLQTGGFHSTDEITLNFKQIDAVKSDMYLEDLMSFVCGKAYFYGLFKDTNSTGDVYRYLPKEITGDRYEFIANTTIQFQSDCFEMVDDFRDELIAFFKKDHIFPVMEWCHLQKNFCSRDEVIDYKAYAVQKDEKNPNGEEKIVELRIKDEVEEDSEKKDDSEDEIKKNDNIIEDTTKDEL